MHRALAQRDILSHVFGQLADEWDQTHMYHPDRARPKVTLRSAGLTCRSFQGPALDALWRTIDGSMLPLLRLIPNFRNIEGVWNLVGPVTGSMLLRYRVHASRVRKIRIHKHELLIKANVYTTLRRALGSALLPSLQELRCSFDHASPALCVLVTPTLLHVHIYLSWTREYVHSQEHSPHLYRLQTQVVETFLYDLLDNAPCLRRLNLKGNISSGVPSHILPGFTQLNCLTLAPSFRTGSPEYYPLRLTCEDFLAFSSIASLATLNLGLHGVEIPEDADPIKFSCLRELSLWGTPHSMHTVLNLLRPTEVEKLRLLVGGPEPYDHCQSLFQSIAFPTLLDIELTILSRPMNDVTDPDHRDALSLFASLLRCRRLKRVKVDMLMFAPISADDTMLLSMAEAWPKLVELDLTFTDGSSTMPTIRSLGVFSARCPDLQQLSISVDANSPFPASGDLPICHHTLRWLQIWADEGHKIKDPVEVAQWICTLFPSVQDVSVPGDEKEGDVKRMVKAFQAMRTVHEQQSVQSNHLP
ncbi:hypothetical protein OE88DRAFT_857334 [Heliocybe sulcata]|uniref:F-box domain-containing protein n=1 Tax=Heliocybe sulcata TaxID=5364 RepID=A0A5C3MP42_9AGAM|nr:hypothetical protein OE88DRAFT_857334 [Heliocybe sulcata]